MCDSYTRQDYLFLSSFGDSGVGFSQLDIFQRMSENCISYDNTKFHLGNPRTLEKMFRSASEAGFISKPSPAMWQLTAKGQTHRQELYDSHILPDNMERQL